MRYTMRNIEDWDFRNCYAESPNYDIKANLFFGTHFSIVVAVSSMRMNTIARCIELGIAELEPDKEHARLGPVADGFLASSRSGLSRLTRDGRVQRRVLQALRRENRKHGRVLLTILPPLPGFLEATSD